MQAAEEVGMIEWGISCSANANVPTPSVRDGDNCRKHNEESIE